jgi:hypothetical protein
MKEQLIPQIKKQTSGRGEHFGDAGLLSIRQGRDAAFFYLRRYSFTGEVLRLVREAVYSLVEAPSNRRQVGVARTMRESSRSKTMPASTRR